VLLRCPSSILIVSADAERELRNRPPEPRACGENQDDANLHGHASPHRSVPPVRATAHAAIGRGSGVQFPLSHRTHPRRAFCLTCDCDFVGGLHPSCLSCPPLLVFRKKSAFFGWPRQGCADVSNDASESTVKTSLASESTKSAPGKPRGHKRTPYGVTTNGPRISCERIGVDRV
jgi:hypothetical protein